MGSTPVANGSRVPVWPTRRRSRARRTRSTTSWEVGPAGLSTTSTPLREMSTRRLLLVHVGIRLRLLQQPRHALGRVEALVVLEDQLRRVAHANALPQLAPHE